MRGEEIDAVIGEKRKYIITEYYNWLGSLRWRVYDNQGKYYGEYKTMSAAYDKAKSDPESKDFIQSRK